MPEWYLMSAHLVGQFIISCFATLGFFWAPLLWAWALFVFSLLINNCSIRLKRLHQYIVATCSSKKDEIQITDYFPAHAATPGKVVRTVKTWTNTLA
jgi:hypothetical protein